MLHSKEKGNIGEMAVAKDLLRHRWEVFYELGDLSKVDLIIHRKGILLRIQVKFVSAKKER